MLPKEILPALTTPESCAALGQKMEGKRVVALWATTKPRSSVAILLRFRRMLQKRGYFCLFLLRSNAVDTFFKIAESDDMDGSIYILDKALLEHCSFIQALFSHDYCCGASILTFRGKLYYFQHNLFSSGPLPMRDMHVDGIISPSRKYNTELDFSIFPNSMKREFTKDLKIIPAGYPKLDILKEAFDKRRPPFKRISYYPIMLNDFNRRHILSQMSLLLKDFLRRFFAAFPDWEFVLRPFPPDRKNIFFQDIINEFSRENLTLDTGEDNIESLVSCDVFITDYSSTYLNYAYATLRPTIFLQPDCEKATDNEFGHIVKNAGEAIEALYQALNSLPDWEEKLRQQRDRCLCNPGQTLGYLCDHMDILLQGKTAKDWISLPKLDTPYTTPAAWLRLFSLPILKKSLGFIPPFLQEANKLCGRDPRIALAALRAYLRAWRGKRYYAAHWVLLQEKLEEALEQTPPRWSLALLRFLSKKEELKSIALYFLAYTLHNTQGSSADARNEIRETLLKTLPLDIDAVLSSRISVLMLQYEMHSEAIKTLSKITLVQDITVEARPAFAMLQMQNGNKALLYEALQQWENDKVQPDQTGLPFLKQLLRLAESNGSFPSFFFSKKYNGAKIILYNVPVYFNNSRHIRQYLIPLFSVLLDEARNNPSLYPQTLAVARLCGLREGVAVCAWEMFKARQLSPRLMRELEADGFGAELAELRQIINRFVKTHSSRPAERKNKRIPAAEKRNRQ